MSIKTILVVDDTSDNVEMLSRWLKRKGYKVACATNGQEAIDTALMAKPDIIFMDLSMPVMSGLEATVEIRATQSVSEIPIIALTAHAMASDRAECLRVGCNDVLTKPIDFEALTKCLQTYLRDDAGSVALRA